MNRHTFNTLYDFTGKTIVITGGAGILAGEMACTLAELGANVAILDLQKAIDKAEAQRARLEESAGRYLYLAGDVLNREALAESAQQVVDAFGRVDALINAAGGNHPQAGTGVNMAFFDLPDDALRFVFNLNIIGTMLPSQVFAKIMAGQGEGNILNISSMNAFRPLTRIPAYSAAKAGVSNFTQWLAVHMAREYSPRIRVNAIAPGFFITDQNRFLLETAEGGHTARGQSVIDHTPMGRFGRPEDLLGAVLWLLSPASAFVTGTIIPIDGGFSAYSGV